MRRHARVLALQAFFSYETQDFETSIEDVFEQAALLSEQDDGTLDEGIRKYAFKIVKFAAQNLEKIDKTLSKYTQGWSFERLCAIDRNLLRIATAEMDEKFGVPVKVVINEAIEIAKVFGTDDSAKFVNAVLDKVKNETNIFNTEFLSC